METALLDKEDQVRMAGLLVIALFFLVLYFIIGFAIDGSETGKNIRIIKNILAEKNNFKEAKEAEPDPGFDITTVPIEQCPACNAKLRTGDRHCSACGLRVFSMKEKDVEE